MSPSVSNTTGLVTLHADLGGNGRWADLYKDTWRIGCEDSVYATNGVTTEQAQAWVDGELDYCSGCQELVAPLDEAFCRECMAVP